MNDAPQIDADDPLPILERGVEKAAAEADTGIVDENVHGLDLRVYRLGERAHALGVGDVDDFRHRVASERADVLGGAARGAFLDVADDDVRAPAGERQRRLPADAAAGSGHQDRFPGEVRDVHSSPSTTGYRRVGITWRTPPRGDG